MTDRKRARLEKLVNLALDQEGMPEGASAAMKAVKMVRELGASSGVSQHVHDRVVTRLARVTRMLMDEQERVVALERELREARAEASRWKTQALSAPREAPHPVREIRSKRISSCLACGHVIRPGMWICWQKGRGAWHATCARDEFPRASGPPVQPAMF